MPTKLFRLNTTNQDKRLFRSIWAAYGRFVDYCIQFMHSRSSNLFRINASQDISLSRGLRRRNNGKQNFQLRDALQRTSVEQLDSNAGYMCKESNQRNEHEQSYKSCESNKSSEHATTASAACTCARASARNGGRTNCTCSSSASGSSSSNSNSIAKDGDLPNPHGNTCSCPGCRGYAEYTATFNTKGEGVSSWLWISAEPRSFKQTDADATDRVEQCTGIPAGVTV